MNANTQHDLLTLGGRLAFAIESRETSQTKVAKLAKCSPQLISQLVTGTTTSTAKLPDIARALSVRHDWLYYGHGNMELGSEIVLDEDLFLICVEATIEAAQSAGANLSPAEIARLALDLYETSMNDGSSYTKAQISSVAPLVIRHHERAAKMNKK